MSFAVGAIKSAFTELQQKILSTENELEKIELRFYDIVSRKAVELAGINEQNEEEIEQHR